MIVIALIIVFPVYVMVISSFKQNEDIFSMELLPKLSSLTLNNYITVFTEENLGTNIWNSFFVATIVTVVALIFHAMSGYALARLEFKGKKVIFTWVISTLMIPFSVIMIPLFVIVKEMGLMNKPVGNYYSYDSQCIRNLSVPSVFPWDTQRAGGISEN